MTGVQMEWAFLCGSEFTVDRGIQANVRWPLKGMLEKKSVCG